MQFNEELVRTFNPFLKSMSKKVYSMDSADSILDKDDVYSLLLEYLWEATTKYDESRGASFKSFVNLYISSRVKNIRRGVARRNSRGTQFLEDFTVEEQNDIEISVYSPDLVVDLKYDLEALQYEFNELEKDIVDNILLHNLDLKDYAVKKNITYSKAYRQLGKVKDKITKIIH